MCEMSFTNNTLQLDHLVDIASAFDVDQQIICGSSNDIAQETHLNAVIIVVGYRARCLMSAHRNVPEYKC